MGLQRVGFAGNLRYTARGGSLQRVWPLAALGRRVLKWTAEGVVKRVADCWRNSVIDAYPEYSMTFRRRYSAGIMFVIP